MSPYANKQNHKKTSYDGKQNVQVNPYHNKVISFNRNKNSYIKKG